MAGRAAGNGLGEREREHEVGAVTREPVEDAVLALHVQVEAGTQATRCELAPDARERGHRVGRFDDDAHVGLDAVAERAREDLESPGDFQEFFRFLHHARTYGCQHRALVRALEERQVERETHVGRRRDAASLHAATARLTRRVPRRSRASSPVPQERVELAEGPRRRCEGHDDPERGAGRSVAVHGMRGNGVVSRSGASIVRSRPSRKSWRTLLVSPLACHAA